LDNKIAITHIAYHTDPLGLLAAQTFLADRKIDFQLVDTGIAYSVFFNDPDGHELEITTYYATALGGDPEAHTTLNELQAQTRESYLPPQ